MWVCALIGNWALVLIVIERWWGKHLNYDEAKTLTAAMACNGCGLKTCCKLTSRRMEYGISRESSQSLDFGVRWASLNLCPPGSWSLDLPFPGMWTMGGPGSAVGIEQAVTRGSSSDAGLPLHRLGHGQVLSEASLEATLYRSNWKALLSWKKKRCCP